MGEEPRERVDAQPLPTTWARRWFAVTASAVLAGIVIQLFVSAGYEEGFFRTPTARAGNVFAFFTVQSNLIVGFTSFLLARRWDRGSARFRVLWLSGLVAIVLTFMVYHSVLAGLDDLSGWGSVANQILHTAVPTLAVLGWLLFGPRGLADWRIISYALIWPIAWLAFTLVRGAFVDWYPYPFIDVIEHGYARVALNTLAISALYVVLAAAVTELDRRLAKARDRRRGLVPGKTPDNR